MFFFLLVIRLRFYCIERTASKICKNIMIMVVPSLTSTSRPFTYKYLAKRQSKNTIRLRGIPYTRPQNVLHIVNPAKPHSTTSVYISVILCLRVNKQRCHYLNW
jgi:hypothetical protein